MTTIDIEAFDTWFDGIEESQLIARVDGQIVGVCGFCVEKYTCGLRRLFVAPEWRRQKVATSLVMFSIAKATELGMNSLNLLVEDSNMVAVTLYKSLGFVAYQVYEDGRMAMALKL